MTPARLAASVDVPSSTPVVPVNSPPGCWSESRRAYVAMRSAAPGTVSSASLPGARPQRGQGWCSERSSVPQYGQVTEYGAGAQRRPGGILTQPLHSSSEVSPPCSPAMRLFPYDQHESCLTLGMEVEMPPRGAKSSSK